MGYKVIIAEKRSVGTDIARVLGVKNRENGYMEGNGYIVSWAQGHLCGLKNADGYDPKLYKWSEETLPIIPERFQHEILSGKKMQFDILRELMNRDDVSQVINACDAGREGELIFRNIYLLTGCRKPMKRLWISSMEDKAILDGFMNLKDGEDYHNLYLAASCREMADWLVGINLTRKLSLCYHRTLNVGRVVSPTLSILASRQKEIKNFRSETYYNVKIKCDDFTAVSDRFETREEADNACMESTAKSAECIYVDTVIKKEKAPLLYDLTALQRDANKRLGYTAKETLDIAQSLYEKKLTTYPRTDSRYVTDDMLDKIKSTISICGHILDESYSIGYEDKLCDSSKVTDHYAIIPTGNIESYDNSTLSEKEFNILKLIEQSVLIASAPDYEYESCTAKVRCGCREYTAKYIRVNELGWKKYFSKTDDEPDVIPSGLNEGEYYYVNDISVNEGKTKPKANYTEDTLLSAMENAGAKDMPDDAERKGLGTPATRAGIIEKLVSTGLVKREKNKLIPNDTGMNLVEVLPEELKSPLLTAEWEQELKKVEKGEIKACDFMEDITDMVKSIVRNYSPVSNAEELFPSGREIIGKCPRCGKNVTEEKYKDGKVKGYFCEGIGCDFGLWKDNKFLTPRHINLDRATAMALITEGRIKLPQIHSLKNGKSYCGTLILDDDGERSSYRIMI